MGIKKSSPAEEYSLPWTGFSIKAIKILLYLCLRGERSNLDLIHPLQVQFYIRLFCFSSRSRASKIVWGEVDSPNLDNYFSKFLSILKMYFIKCILSIFFQLKPSFCCGTLQFNRDNFNSAKKKAHGCKKCAFLFHHRLQTKGE